MKKPAERPHFEQTAVTTILVVAVVLLSIATIAFVLVLTLYHQEGHNGENMNLIHVVVLGVLMPIILSLLALMQRRSHIAMNGRLSQLLERTRELARLESQRDEDDA